MAKPYEVFSNYFPHESYKGHLKTAEKQMGTSVMRIPGMEIMAKKPTNFLDLFNKMVDYVHRGGKGFQWAGSAGGTGGYPMLDGDKKQGECAMFSVSLAMLAWAPAPYGLGLRKADVFSTSYNGPNKKGFVSNHPTIGVLGLPPNVAGQPLYFWDNHKVVSYQGRFYDVMYNQIYNALSDMVAYAVEENEVDIDGTTYYPCEATGPGNPGKAGTWFKEFPATVYGGPSPSMPF